MISCTQQFNSEYKDLLRGVFVREWIRLTGGEAALQDYDRRVTAEEAFNVPDEVGNRIDQCIASMQSSGTVPGIWQDEEGKCYQDWTMTACFARWYHSSTDNARADIQAELEKGNSKPWEAFNDKAVNPCPAGQPPSSECCSSTVWADPVYLKLSDEGAYMDSKTPWGAILGLGVFGVGLAWILTRKGGK